MCESCQTVGQIGAKFFTYNLNYADSSRNEHRQKNNYPLEIPGDILEGLSGQKFKYDNCG